MTSVLIFIEADETGAASQASLQAITGASKVSPSNVIAVTAGSVSGSDSLPVDKVIDLPGVETSDDGIFDSLTSDISELIQSNSPDLVLFSKSDQGAVVSARVAFRLGAAFAADCTDITGSAGAISVTRPVYGGSALADFSIASTPAIVSLRAGAFEPSASEGGTPATEQASSSGEGLRGASVLNAVAESREGVRLEDAPVVVSGGRGLGGPEPFAVLEDLANSLEGAVGASRAACDAGWIDHSHQVGLTGKSVSPDVYIAVGISGASQHMAGCSSSRAIVAINKDGDSNIFKEARFGVVGDWEKVLPAFIEQVKALKG